MIAEVLRLESLSQLDELVPGPIMPANPVKFAVYQAFMNANGEPIRVFISNHSDDMLSSTEVIRQSPRVVDCLAFSGMSMSLWQLFGYGPLFSINCGHCGATFQKRIAMIDNPRVECPRCKTLNRMPLEVDHGSDGDDE